MGNHAVNDMLAEAQPAAAMPRSSQERMTPAAAPRLLPNARSAEHLIAQPEGKTEIALTERLETAVIYTRQLSGKKFRSSFTIELIPYPGSVVKINDLHYDPSWVHLAGNRDEHHRRHFRQRRIDPSCPYLHVPECGNDTYKAESDQNNL